MSEADFDRFWREVWGEDRPPFPWQKRLAAQLLQSGSLPPALDLPTGVGKTSVIDIALFALAHRPEDFPRRVVFVVDRRVIVDQAARHATALAGALARATSGSLAHTVASRLRGLWGGTSEDPPFGVATLRGGVPRDPTWADRPDRPMVVVSTVDQAGSRLLFRGYGLSPSQQPVHAGLLGSDALFLLDEVHLSVPFAETLEAISRLRRHTAKPLRPWAFLAMSATLQPTARRSGAPFALDEDDLAHPVLQKRLESSKIARLSEVPAKGRDEANKRSLLATSAAKEARAFLAKGARAVAVVVNRVDTARSAYETLLAAVGPATDVYLLTGRMRPLDRDDLLDRRDANGMSLLDRIRAGRDRRASSRPLVVVATQSIEAGADFDFDALVTECPSLDALRQRFGRLDRLGELGTAPAVVLMRSDLAQTDDPIYGTAAAETWRWLSARATPDADGDPAVDLGIRRLQLPNDPAELETLLAPSAHAPVLLPPHLDAWSQTNPAPTPDRDVAAWLHGPDRSSPEVQIVWRADIDEEDLVRALGSEQTEATGELIRRVGICPPSSQEALSVPLWAARAWLAERPSDAVADAPQPPADDDAKPSKLDRPFFRWRGAENSASLVLADSTEIEPGDLLIVPAKRGGIAGHRNWDPTSTEPVADLGDLASWHQRRWPALRLRCPSEALAALALRSTSEPPLPWADDESRPDCETALLEWLQALAVENPDNDFAAALRPRLRGNRLRAPHLAILVCSQGNERWWSIATRRPLAAPRGRLGGGIELANEDDNSSLLAPGEVTLRRHLADVSKLVGDFARRLGLASRLVADLELAGRGHDAGKADPRFQSWLAGGDPIRALAAGEPLAKSAGDLDAAARLRARERSGYPKGTRHELLSTQLVADWFREAAHDPDLALHLVASHHGYCRPLAPVVDDPQPVPVELWVGDRPLRASSAHQLARLDSPIAQRFWSLTERYGHWTLALLETLLRLADHRASELERGSASDPSHSLQGDQP
jgi:CRISPR-associated endonuclease/helicase Cas3